MQWHPDFMRLRFRNWTENLNLDWCISRQRYFGVPFPVWYAVGRGRGHRLLAPVAGGRSRAADRPHDGRAGGLQREPARPARRLPRRRGRVRHLVHVFAHAADRDRLVHAARAPPQAVPDGPATAEPRDHPDLGVLHDREGAAARADDPVAARRDLGLGARPGPQEDVEEQGQRDHAHAPARPVRLRRRALLVAGRAAGHRHRLRREGAEGRPPARDEAVERGEVRARAVRARGAGDAPARRRLPGAAAAARCRKPRRRSRSSTTRPRSTRSSASSGPASPTTTSRW